MTRIVIGNLPDDISEEQVREALKQFAPAEKVTLVRDSSPPTAIIETEAPRGLATNLATRINGHLYQGRALTAWVPVMDWK